jgi:hypothetical protein
MIAAAEPFELQLQRRKNRANGSWYIRPWVDVVTANGLERRKKNIVLGAADEMGKREAQAAKNRAMAVINRASYVVQSQIRFGIILDEFETRHLTRQSAPTQNKYRSLIKAHIRKAFGELQLHEITTKRVQDWLDAKALPVPPVVDATGKELKPAKPFAASWSTRSDIRRFSAAYSLRRSRGSIGRMRIQSST